MNVFSIKYEKILSAVKIFGAEDNIVALQATTTAIVEKVKSLSSNLVDLESHSYRRWNLRLVNLQEGPEGSDTCSFLSSGFQRLCTWKHYVYF